MKVIMILGAIALLGIIPHAFGNTLTDHLTSIINDFGGSTVIFTQTNPHTIIATYNDHDIFPMTPDFPGNAFNHGNVTKMEDLIHTMIVPFYYHIASHKDNGIKTIDVLALNSTQK